MAVYATKKTCKCNLKEKVDELSNLLELWKNDYSLLSGENKLLRVRLEASKSNKSTRNSNDEDVEALKSQVRTYKQNYVNEKNENERLLAELDELKITLKDTFDQVKTQKTASTMHCTTTFNNYSNDYTLREYERPKYTGYHVTRKQIEDEQRRIVALHSCPSIHYPGTLIARNIVRDAISETETINNPARLTNRRFNSL